MSNKAKAFVMVVLQDGIDEILPVEMDIPDDADESDIREEAQEIVENWSNLPYEKNPLPQGPHQLFFMTRRELVEMQDAINQALEG